MDFAATDHTLNSARIRQTLKSHYRTGTTPSNRPYFNCLGTSRTSVGILGIKDFWDLQDNVNDDIRVQARTTRAQELCKQFHSAARDLDRHVSRLETVLSSLVDCLFPQYGAGSLLGPGDLREDAIVDDTLYLLSRLPHIPLDLETTTSSPYLPELSNSYLVNPEEPALWGNLKIVLHISTPVVLLALLITAGRKYHKEWEMYGEEALRELVNTFIELLEVASSMSSPTDSIADGEAWLIVQSCLWVSWQRCAMILRWYMLGLHLKGGFDSQLQGSFSLRQYQSVGSVHYNVPQYMCRWAFRLLRSDRSSLCQDFRRLFEIFDEAFPVRRPRCILRSTNTHLQCDGSSVDNCQRFKGQKIIDQSAHAGRAHECRPLYWDERSYRAVDGARAVSLDENPTDDKLVYCLASETTLAISHVWSHGQGGRPETSGTGFNICLHRRYCRIAREFGCTSYWMDTPCIPQDHQLRAEAISHINGVFAKSKMTLICDRDLMELDLKEMHGIKIYEAIIAVLLVCDWNVRAWTLLESMRGRRHIHVLCKHEQVISVRKALEAVYKDGPVDLAILAFTSQHMLPWLDRLDASIPGWDPDLFPLKIPEATCFLVNRHASRPGDDVVIWSLLTGSKPFFDIKNFWREAERIFLEFRTGHLMSDLPRLEHIPGLRWAPSQPRLANSIRRFQSTTLGGGSHNVDTHHEQIYDGVGSRYGQILPGGAFQAVWCVHEFTALLDTEHINLDTADIGMLERKEVLSDIAGQFMVTGRRSCLLRPASHDFLQDENQTILYRGSGGGPLVAVVSHHRKHAWKWEGLYEWPLEIELPSFNHKTIWIV